MQNHVYADYPQLEEKHWWYAARREIVSYLIKHYSKTDSPLALNIGCGTGGLALALKSQVHVMNLDLNQQALQFCQNKNLNESVFVSYWNIKPE